MQSVSSRIWTRVAVSISYDDNDYTTGTSKLASSNSYHAITFTFERLPSGKLWTTSFCKLYRAITIFFKDDFGNIYYRISMSLNKKHEKEKKKKKKYYLYNQWCHTIRQDFDLP